MFEPTAKVAQLALAFVDVETTGLSPRFGHRVIEVGVLRVEAGRVVEAYEQLINPGRPVGRSIAHLTGISDAMVAHAPPFPAVIDRLRQLLVGAVVVGHNASFDASFLRSEFAAAGRTLHEDLNDPPVLDTLRLARRTCRGQRNGLAALCARLNVTADSAAHRALADCHRTFGVFCEMLRSHGGFDLTWRDLAVIHGPPGSLRDRAAQRNNFSPPLPQLLSAAQV